MNNEHLYDLTTQPEPFDKKACFIEPYFYSKPNTINLLNYPKPKWSIEFAPDCFIHTPRGVNWFHRLMQRWILGFKWKKLNK
jgi:hypothetical protein